MIVRVKGPAGSGKATVIQSGLDAMGVDYRILRCDVLDILDLDRYLSGPEPVFVLTEMDRMRPDFRKELEAKIAKVSKTFWVVDTG